MQSSPNKLSLLDSHPTKLPANCLPIFAKKNSSKSIYKLIEINNSIQQLMDGSIGLALPRKKKRECIGRHEKASLQGRSSSQSQHNQLTHVSSDESPLLNRILAKNSGRHEKKSVQMIPSVSQILPDKRVNTYDSQIDKYIEDKYNSKEMIEKYLVNRQAFIRQVCRDIEHNLRQDGRKEREDRQSQHQERLPKIQECLPHSPQKAKLQMYWRNTNSKQVSRSRLAKQYRSKPKSSVQALIWEIPPMK